MGFLPAFAPFAAVVYSLAGRRSLTINDGFWFAGALAFAIPVAIHHGLVAFVSSLLVVIAPWLLYRAVSQLPRLPVSRRNLIGIGLVTSLGLVVLVGLLRVEQFNFAYSNFLQAIVWNEHPALFGHGILALGIASALFNSRFRLKLLSLVISAVGILISGTREAAVVWLIFAILMPIVDRAITRGQRVLAGAATVVVLAIFAVLGVATGWGRTGFLIDLMPSLSSVANLVQSSELPHSSWWMDQGVTIESETVEIGGDELTGYTVRKLEADSWLRLQQVVPLTPGQDYTVSAWVKQPIDETLPGIQGWGELTDGQPFTLIAVLAPNDRVAMSGTATRHLLDYGIADRYGDWLRVYFSFSFEPQLEPLHWYVGLAPDNRPIAGTANTFAAFDVKAESVISSYVPGVSSRSVGIDVARVPYWRAALNGFLESPVIGVPHDFHSYFELRYPERERIHGTPAHAHNLFLQLLFERGLFGLVGLSLILVAIALPAMRARDLPLLLAILVILIANWFDISFFYGSVLYPIVAIAAWRHPKAMVDNEASPRTLIARLTLAVTDYASAFLALFLAVLIAWGFNWSHSPIAVSTASMPVLLYALLLWPAMTLREGLYPGYGLPRPLELKKLVSGIVIAWLVFAAGVLLIPEQLGSVRNALPVFLVLSIIIGTVGRSLAKGALLSLDNWGRPTVVIGTGAIAENLVRSLQRDRLAGYLPVAFFTDDRSRIGQTLLGVPVVDEISGAAPYSVEHSIRHAIVTIDNADQDLLSNRITQGSPTVFRTIQYVPHLSYLPVLGVSAGSLNNILTLQVNNELLSPSRQAYKRVIDVLGSAVGGALILPILALLVVTIMLDSKGNPFFGHTRIGRNGKKFRAWKFRSMVPDAETRLQAYLKAHPELRSEWEQTQKLQDDPRVTRVGRFLRKYSLDELPQLWNVLVGEMSMVGPRPIVADEVSKYGDAYPLYKAVRPGMTGYWQVSGRSDTDYANRVELDSFYVRNWSVWLDIVIILRTFKVVIKGDGAY